MPTDITTDFAANGPGQPSNDLSGLGLIKALAPAESLLIALTLGIGMLAYVLSVAFEQAVAWDKFMISFAPSVGLILLGCYVRLAKDMPRAGMSAVATGIYIGFSGMIAILIYLRFPFEGPVIDMQLMQVDASLFGYEWATFTSGMAAYPAFGKAIGWIYGTSLLQLFVVIFILGFMGRVVDLHRVLITGILSLLLAVAIWWTWPSLGPSAYVTLPHDIESALGLVHGKAEGARMLQMAEMGNPIISPDIIMGTIAFPSYHSVMVCLAVAFVYGTWVFWPMVLLNVGMLPSILSHGGHHLIDMLGGFLVFAIALWVAVKLVPAAPVTGPEV